jgi:hypothetical protein
MAAAKTTQQRVQELRERRRAAGLAPLTIYANPQDFEAIRAYAERLLRKRAKEGKPSG